MRYETGHVEPSESSRYWKWMGQGESSQKTYRPDSIQNNYCACNPVSQCLDSKFMIQLTTNSVDIK